MKRNCCILFLCASVAISAPWAQDRGSVVEAKYLAYVQTLKSYSELLHDQVAHDAPEVLSRLEPPPEKPLIYGYQILPKLSERVAEEATQTNTLPVSTSYSWPITERFIDSELSKIRAAEQKLNEPNPAYADLAEEHRTMIGNQKLIEQHVQYNRFWQKAIASERPRFDRQTLLYRAAVELRTTSDAVRAAELRQSIRDAAGPPTLPAFIRIAQPTPGHTVFHVPVYTDIDDASFLSSVKKGVEKVWHLDEGGGSGRQFQVELAFTLKTSKEIYGEDPAPGRGDHIDADVHALRFPKDGAVLTTGAPSMHAFIGRSIILGADPVDWNAVAHEFGHVLGFQDGYFRGYRDMGPDGFEIFETIPDANDIMCAPGTGRVQLSQFLALLHAG